MTTQGNWWWFVSYNTENKISTAINQDTIKGSWFLVTKKDENNIKIEVDQNETNQSRSLEVSLEAGNYFDSFTVEQE